MRTYLSFGAQHNSKHQSTYLTGRCKMCVVYSFVDPSLILSWCTLFKLLLLSFNKRAKLNLRSANYFTTTSLIFGQEFLSCNDLLVFNWLLMMMPEMKLWFVDLQLNFSLNRKFIYLASTLRAGFINNRLHLHILYSDLTNKQARSGSNMIEK